MFRNYSQMRTKLGKMTAKHNNPESEKTCRFWEDAQLLADKQRKGWIESRQRWFGGSRSAKEVLAEINLTRLNGYSKDAVKHATQGQEFMPNPMAQGYDSVTPQQP